jgi:mitochondrial import receptor subunit TOM40
MASSAVPIPVSALPLSEKPTGPAPLPGYLSPLQPLANVYTRYSSWRTSLGLPHPGTAENLQKEVKG